MGVECWMRGETTADCRNFPIRYEAASAVAATMNGAIGAKSPLLHPLPHTLAWQAGVRTRIAKKIGGLPFPKTRMDQNFKKRSLLDWFGALEVGGIINAAPLQMFEYVKDSWNCSSPPFNVVHCASEAARAISSKARSWQPVSRPKTFQLKICSDGRGSNQSRFRTGELTQINSDIFSSLH